MGHEHLDHENFGTTEILYGYKGDIKDGDLPHWLPRQKIVKSQMKKIMDDIKEDDGLQFVPDGVVRSGREYKMSAQKKFDLFKEWAEKNDQKHTYMTLEVERFKQFDKDTPKVPDDVNQRMTDLVESSAYKREVDGHHKQFRGWQMMIRFGPRGGVQWVSLGVDVHI